MGHSYKGHDSVGRNYLGHNYLGHNYVGHTYMGHTYIGLDYMEDYMQDTSIALSIARYLCTLWTYFQNCFLTPVLLIT